MQTENNFSIPIVLAFLIFGFFSVNHASKDFNPGKIKYVNIAGQKLEVELALTPEEQAQGLGGKTGLGANESMLFVFERPERHYFWMKDMNFAIDIIWLSEDLRVVYIKKDAQPDNFLETYGPDENSKYVLEVNAGFSDKHNLKVGDEVRFSH